MIKIYILTYRDPIALNDNLKSLFESDADSNDYSVEIINNHSTDFHLDEGFKSRVTVHHQGLRPDWSCGTPARDWNAGLVNGFGDLDKPLCDQVILCQDDMIWFKNWKQTLDDIHKTYTFYTCGWGDGFMSFLPEAVKRIGLFDERFSTLGFYEGDYFTRAVLYNQDKSSINDYWHKRVVNPTKEITRRSTFVSQSRTPEYQMAIGKAVWISKWSEDLRPSAKNKNDSWWKDQFKNKGYAPKESFMMYPYFECAVETLMEQNYVIRLGDLERKR